MVVGQDEGIRRIKWRYLGHLQNILGILIERAIKRFEQRSAEAQISEESRDPLSIFF